MDEQLKAILAQIVDNQLILSGKIDILNQNMARLANTIIKYDEEYQQKILEDVNVRS